MNKLGPALALVALIFGSVGCANPTVDEQVEPPSLSVAWMAEPGERTVQCTRLAVDETIDVAAIDVLASPGTQRLTVWTVQDLESDGCPDVDARGLLFDGIDALQLPSDVALRVPAGNALWLRAEIVNDTLGPLRGTSGVSLTTTEEANEIADVVSLSADVADDDSCAMPTHAFVFAVAPVVSSTAHMELTAYSSFAGGDVVLFRGGDVAGAHSLAKPIALVAGESLDVSCVSGDSVSSTAKARNVAKACQVAVYRFPATPIDCQ